MYVGMHVLLSCLWLCFDVILIITLLGFGAVIRVMVALLGVTRYCCNGIQCMYNDEQIND